jgi:hypothetical protein
MAARPAAPVIDPSTPQRPMARERLFPPQAKADGRDFRNAGHIANVRAEIPVFMGGQSGRSFSEMQRF